MTRTGLAAGLALAAVFGAGVPAARAVEINCPLPQIRREVVTPLPPAWWQTPFVNSLTETEVVVIGGAPALQCRYGPAGSIQRLPPSGLTCAAHAGGFTCLPTLAPPPGSQPPSAPFSTGPVSLPQTFLLNLDNGAVASGPGADLWFQAVTPTEMYLTPRNGALMAVGDRSNRGDAGCSTQTFTAARAPLYDLPVGSYVCMKTNQGRISQFRVNGVSSGYPKVLSLGYTTW